METTESTEESLSGSFDVQPNSEGLETSSEPVPSSGSSHRSAAQSVLCARAPKQYSVITEPSSDSLYEATCPTSHQRGHSFGFQPLYVSYIPQNPCNAADLGSSPDPTSTYPCHSSGHSSGSGPYGPGQSSEPSQVSGPTSGPAPASGPSLVSRPDSASGPDSSGSGPALAPGPEPPRPGPPKPGPCVPQVHRCIPVDLLPNYDAWCQHLNWKPQHSWEPLQVSEPGARGPCKPPEVESEEILCKTRPRGQCLLYNWEEERATNQLDQIPPLQDGSESYFFRHGHQGLLSMQLQSPMSSSTTQKDSYQLPRHTCQPLRGVKHERRNQKEPSRQKRETGLPGKREAMLEMLLHHQICKEVQTEQEPTRKLFETESVAHHDYRMELVRAGPPAPTKPHDYRREQPGTFWLQQAGRLPGVSDIRTRDTPFRKNCSFSTPVPLSLGQPLPYELENAPH